MSLLALKYRDYLDIRRGMTLPGLYSLVRRASKVKGGALVKLTLGAVAGVWEVSVETPLGVTVKRSQPAALEPFRISAEVEIGYRLGLQHGDVRSALVRGPVATGRQVLACLSLLQPGGRTNPGYPVWGAGKGSEGLLEPVVALPTLPSALLPMLASAWMAEGGPERSVEVACRRLPTSLLLSVGEVEVELETRYASTKAAHIQRPLKDLKDLLILARQGNRLYAELEQGRLRKEYNLPDREYVRQAVEIAKKHKESVFLNFIIRVGASPDLSITTMTRWLWGAEPPYGLTDKIVTVSVERGQAFGSTEINRIMRLIQSAMNR